MSPCQNCTPRDSWNKKRLPHQPDSERKTPLHVPEKHWQHFSGKMQVLSRLLPRVLKSPFSICSKMAAVGNRKHLFVVVWFSLPCSNMFMVLGPADRRNIWLLCIAERAHIYYTWCSVHLPKSQPACSSVSANTTTHDKNTHSLVFASSTSTHIYLISYISIHHWGNR